MPDQNREGTPVAKTAATVPMPGTLLFYALLRVFLGSFPGAPFEPPNRTGDSAPTLRHR
jgi:hypothetical protein